MRFLTAEEATDHKLALFRLASQLVSNDSELRAASSSTVEKFTPPNPYQRDLAAMRTASATPEQDFESRWKANRLAELNAEHRRFDAHSEARRTEMLRTAEGRKTYPAPDPFNADLKKLRERDARALAAKENR